MSRTTLRNVGIIVLVVLAVAVIPGGSATAELVLAIISLCFLAAIGFLGYRLYMEHKFTLWSMSDPAPGAPLRGRHRRHRDADRQATGCSTAGSARSWRFALLVWLGVLRLSPPGWSHAGTGFSSARA